MVGTVHCCSLPTAGASESPLSARTLLLPLPLGRLLPIVLPAGARFGRLMLNSIDGRSGSMTVLPSTATWRRWHVPSGSGGGVPSACLEFHSLRRAC